MTDSLNGCQDSISLTEHNKDTLSYFLKNYYVELFLVKLAFKLNNEKFTFFNSHINQYKLTAPRMSCVFLEDAKEVSAINIQKEDEK